MSLDPEACIIKHFTAVIYGFCNMLVFFPGKPFQPSLVFASKARAYLSEAPFTYSTLEYGYAPSLTNKHKTRLERLAREKHLLITNVTRISKLWP